jgi:hypothetical protein
MTARNAATTNCHHDGPSRANTVHPTASNATVRAIRAR